MGNREDISITEGTTWKLLRSRYKMGKKKEYMLVGEALCQYVAIQVKVFSADH